MKDFLKTESLTQIYKKYRFVLLILLTGLILLLLPDSGKKEKEVPAAFFVLSHLIEKDTALVTRMFEEGHTVCNHTAKHHDMTKYHTSETFLAELANLEKICTDTTGVEISKYYRPPEGAFSETNLQQAQSLGYQTIFWSFAYADWDNNRQPAPEKAIKKVLENTHNGAVILLPGPPSELVPMFNNKVAPL